MQIANAAGHAELYKKDVMPELWRARGRMGGPRKERDVCVRLVRTAMTMQCDPEGNPRAGVEGALGP